MKKNSIIIYFIALLKSTFFSFYGFGLLDEGESLHNAKRIVLGELPYKDFYAIFPPVDNYYYYFIFRIFGESVTIPRLVSSTIFSFFPVFLYLITKKYIGNKLSILLCLLIIVIDVNVERLYIFTPIYLALFLYFNAKDRFKLYFLSGLFLGLISTVRFDLPGTYFVAIFVAIVVHYIHKSVVTAKLTPYLIGYLIFPGIILYWMHIRGILSFFYKYAVESALVVTNMHSLPFPKLWQIVPTSFNVEAFVVSFTSIFAWTMIATYLLTIFRFVSRIIPKKDSLFVLIFLITGILTIPYISGRSDLGHMIKGGIPFLILLFYNLKNPLKSKAFIVKFFNLCCYMFVLILIVFSIVQSLYWIKMNDSVVSIGKNTIRVPENVVGRSTYPSSDTLTKSVLFLNETNGNVLVVPYMAGLYYLSNKNSTSAYNNILAGFIINRDEEDNFINNIKLNKVERVIYDPFNGPKMKLSRFSEYNPQIHKYLMENYYVVYETPEGWLFMKNKLHD